MPARFTHFLRMTLAKRSEWIVPVAAFLLMTIPHVSLIPQWDSFLFFDCLVSASSFPLNVQNFLCLNHPSAAYIGLLALPQFIFHGSVVVLHLSNIALGVVAILAFRSLTALICGGKEQSWERMILTTLFAMHPAVLSTTLHFTLDTGLLFFFVMFIAALFRRRYGLAALLGACLIFTKETGTMLYAAGLAGHLFQLFAENRSLPAENIRRLRVFVLPFLLFVAYLLFQITVLKNEFPLHSSNLGDVEENMLYHIVKFDYIEKRFWLLIADITVLNFAWISTIIGLACAAIARKTLRKDPLFLAVLATATVQIFLLTRYVPYNNIRYLATAYPVCLLLLLLSLRAAVQSQTRRALLLGALMLSTIVATRFSVDPLSRAIYGTFAYGQRDMYTLGPALDDACCAMGRDQLAYNLQFASIAAVQKDIMVETSQSDAPVVGNEEAWSLGYPALHPETHRPAFDGSGIFPPLFTVREILMQDPLPEKIYFVDFPNLHDNWDMRVLTRNYRTAWQRAVSRNGHEVTLYGMELR